MTKGSLAWLSQPAGVVDHSRYRRARVTAAHDALVFPRDPSAVTKMRCLPLAKVGLGLPVARAIVHHRTREIPVRTTAERHRAVNAVLAVNVVAKRLGVFQRHLECSLAGLDTGWPFPHHCRRACAAKPGLTTNPDCDGHSTDRGKRSHLLFSAPDYGATGRFAACPSTPQRAEWEYSR